MEKTCKFNKNEGHRLQQSIFTAYLLDNYWQLKSIWYLNVKNGHFE